MDRLADASTTDPSDLKAETHGSFFRLIEFDLSQVHEHPDALEVVAVGNAF